MSGAIDTNVLFDAVNAAAPDHAVCRALLERLRGGADPWYLTWNVAYEFLRLVTHPRVLPRPLSAPAAMAALQAIAAAPTCQWLLPTARHAEVLAVTLREHPERTGNGVFDVHTAVLLREHGVRRLYSRDGGFEGFGFLEVVGPEEGGVKGGPPSGGTQRR